MFSTKCTQEVYSDADFTHSFTESVPAQPIQTDKGLVTTETSFWASALSARVKDVNGPSAARLMIREVP